MLNILNTLNTKYKILNTRFYIALAILILVGPLVYLITKHPRSASAGWWDDTWHYRKTVAITNSSGGTLTNQRVKFSLDTATLITAGKMQSDCDDIRVTDSNGSLLNHWDTICNNASTNIYVKIPSLLSTGTTLYVYYGNPSASNIEPTLGASSNPGTSCEMMKDQGSVTTDGAYYVVPGGNDTNSIQVYCDITTLSEGWTLVINNNSSITTNPEPVWNDAINSVNTTGTFGSTLTAFDLILGLTHWNYLGSTAMVQVGTSPSNIEKRATYDSISLNTGNNYALSLGTQTLYLGADTPGIKSYSAANNYQFSTSDDDNDVYADNCAIENGSSPWWYGSCWVGSFWGGGDSDGYENAPYWIGMYHSYGAIYLGGADTMKNVSSGSASAEEKGTSPIAYWSFDEGYNTTVHNQMEKNGENGLVSWWKMDEGTGTTAPDTMNINIGTLGTGTSAPTRSTSGKIGNALSFDGNDYVSISDSSTLRPSQITVTAWVKSSNWSGQTHPMIVAKGVNQEYILWYDSEESKFGFRIGNVAVTSYSTTTPANDTWYHLVGTYDGTTNKIYLNGTLQDSDSYSGGIPANTRPLVFGAGSTSGTSYSNFLNGIIDNVKIFNRILSSSEIDSEYRSIHGQMINMSASSDWVDGAQPNSNQKPLGKALDFDGSDDYVTVADTNNSLDFTDSFTIEAWLYIDSLPTSGNIKSITTKWVSNTGWDLRLFNNSGTQKIGFGIDGAERDTSYTLPTSQWIHFVGVHNATSDVDYFYLNGVQIASITSSTTDASANAATTEIGRMNSTYGRYFDGKIDEVKLFDSAISTAQIKKEYNRGVSVAMGVGKNVNIGATGPVGYWKLDEGSAYTAFDSSGNNKTGTLGVGNSAPTWTDGKVGKALSFDGINDYVPITTSTTGIMGSAFTSATAEAWVYLTGTPSSTSYIFEDGTTDGWIVIGVNTSSQPFVQTRQAASPYTSVYATSSTALSLNTWYHITGIVDASNLYLYVNGIYNTSNTHTGICVVDNDGVRINNGTFPGKIDEVKIYNYSLTADQIKVDYNNGAAVKY